MLIIFTFYMLSKRLLLNVHGEQVSNLPGPAQDQTLLILLVLSYLLRNIL